MPTEIPSTPQTRTEQYLAAANGQEVELPAPLTREEAYLHEIATKMQGGSSVTVEPLSVTENGEYTAPSGKAYSPVTVAVPEEMYFRSAKGLGSFFQIANGYSKPDPMPPEEVIIKAPNCQNVNSFLAQYLANEAYSIGIKKVTLDVYATRLDASNFVYRNISVQEITFTASTVHLYAGFGFATESKALETINGELNFELWNSTSYRTSFSGANVLKNIRIRAGCIKYSATFSSPVLTDASLVSIANALSDTVTGMTLTHDATAKARCGQIVGTVAEGVFTQDAAGSVTLTDFITNTKGWTLA